MNNYGVVLNSIGLEGMMDRMQSDFVAPMAAALFPEEGARVDHHHTFMVQYKAGEDLGLDMHTDDSKPRSDSNPGLPSFLTLILCSSPRVDRRRHAQRVPRPRL